VGITTLEYEAEPPPPEANYESQATAIFTAFFYKSNSFFGIFWFTA